MRKNIDKLKKCKTSNKSKNTIKILFVFNTCKKCGPTNVVLNIIKNLDFSKFEPVILTLSEEKIDSNLEEFRKYAHSHYFCRVSKADIMIGKLGKLTKIINDISPDVIHTTGVFPDFAISKTAPNIQVITMHNYAPFDYVAKFGKIRGRILVRMQYYAAERAAKTIACSESLTILYRKDNLELKYIRNGVDINHYNIKEQTTQKNSRKCNFIYTGHLSKEKNVSFVLNAFSKVFFDNQDIKLFVLGSGTESGILEETYQRFSNIRFVGRVSDVAKYLEKSDIYVSASRSEGMPNGVLEAIASGLPILLSDIPQHEEILNAGGKCGYSFSLDSEDDLREKMHNILNDNLKTMSRNSRLTAEKYFNSVKMSNEYQKIYQEVAKNA